MCPSSVSARQSNSFMLRPTQLNCVTHHHVCCCCSAAAPCSDDVQSAVQEQLSKLYGPQAEEPGFQFLAIHMRLGGMENEKSLRSSKGGRNGPLLDLMDGLACIQKLGKV